MSLFFNKKKLIASAEKNIGENNFLKAEKILEKILSKDSKDPYVLELMATVKDKLGAKQEAYSLLKEAANIYERNNQIQQTINTYKKLLQISPGDTAIANSLADIFISKEKEGDAFKILLTTGENALKEKNIDAAFVMFKRALEIRKNDVEVLKNLLEIYKEKNDKEKIKELSLKIGNELFKLGKFSDSYLYFYDVINNIDPNNYDANINIIKVLIKLKNFKDAYTYLNSFMDETGISNDEILKLKVEILSNLDKNEELKITLTKLLALNEKNYSFLFSLSENFISKGLYTKAVEILDVLDLRKYDDYSHEINNTLEKVLNFDPKNEKALEKLIEFKKVIGDHYSLIELYRSLYDKIIERGDIKKAYKIANQWMQIDESDWIRKEVRRLKLMLERSEGISKDLSGKLEKAGLADLLQMLENGQKTGVLKIYFADRVGRIYMKKGKIINAFFEDKNGTEAFLLLMKLSQGDFVFQEEDISNVEDKFANSNNMQLILEALRIIDEQTKEQK